MMKRVFVLLLLCGMAWGQCKHIHDKYVDAYPCEPLKPEPEDVPAIKVPIPKEKQATCGDSGNLAMCSPAPTERWGCADKLRILEHDESEPPHYYCRKPQTEAK
jgi:hypothetical protein